MSLEIILMDNNPTIQKTLHYFLQAYSPLIHSFNEHNNFPQEVKDTKPDLIFLDSHHIQHKNKIESFQKRNIPIIFLSTEGEEVPHSYQGELKKPIDLKKLKDLVNAFVPRTQNLNISSFLKYQAFDEIQFDKTQHAFSKTSSSDSVSDSVSEASNMNSPSKNQELQSSSSQTQTNQQTSQPASSPNANQEDLASSKYFSNPILLDGIVESKKNKTHSSSQQKPASSIQININTPSQLSSQIPSAQNPSSIPSQTPSQNSSQNSSDQNPSQNPHSSSLSKPVPPRFSTQNISSPSQSSVDQSSSPPLTRQNVTQRNEGDTKIQSSQENQNISPPISSPFSPSKNSNPIPLSSQHYLKDQFSSPSQFPQSSTESSSLPSLDQKIQKLTEQVELMQKNLQQISSPIPNPDSVDQSSLPSLDQKIQKLAAQVELMQKNLQKISSSRTNPDSVDESSNSPTIQQEQIQKMIQKIVEKEVQKIVQQVEDLQNNLQKPEQIQKMIQETARQEIQKDLIQNQINIEIEDIFFKNIKEFLKNEGIQIIQEVSQKIIQKTLPNLFKNSIQKESFQNEIKERVKKITLQEILKSSEGLVQKEIHQSTQTEEFKKLVQDIVWKVVPELSKQLIQKEIDKTNEQDS